MSFIVLINLSLRDLQCILDHSLYKYDMLTNLWVFNKIRKYEIRMIGAFPWTSWDCKHLNTGAFWEIWLLKNCNLSGWTWHGGGHHITLTRLSWLQYVKKEKKNPGVKMSFHDTAFHNFTQRSNQLNQML